MKTKNEEKCYPSFPRLVSDQPSSFPRIQVLFVEKQYFNHKFINEKLMRDMEKGDATVTALLEI